MLFQFHKGTIRTILVLLEIVRFSHFNSIKVQLEPLIVQRLSGLILFQFHKGTIRTASWCWWVIVQTDFNSIKVQLEQAPKYAIKVHFIISIP